MNQTKLARIDLNLLVAFEALMDLRSVTLAAERLGRTQSAVSHALARLREQVGDPLLVKVGGKLQPGPFARTLIEDIRPLLRSIERVITPPADFDPMTSTCKFTLLSAAFPGFVSNVSQRVNAQAPKVDVEWLPVDAKSAAAVVEERADLTMLAPGASVPSGLDAWFSAVTKRCCFARGDHPAVTDWGMEAWLTIRPPAGSASSSSRPLAMPTEGSTRSWPAAMSSARSAKPRAANGSWIAPRPAT